MDAARPRRGGNDVMPRVSHTEATPAYLVSCFYVISHTRPCAMGSPGLTTGLRRVYFGLGVQNWDIPRSLTQAMLQNRDITHHPPPPGF